MKYEFEIFERIINGDLSPFRDTKENIGRFNDLLESKHKTCFNLIAANFKRVGSKYTLLSKKTFSSLHPIANEVNNRQIDIFQSMAVKDLANDLLHLLEIKRPTISEVIFSNSPTTSKLIIKIQKNCQEIPSHEARYYYYNDILNSEVARIKEAIKSNVFEMKNDEEIEHNIHKLQQALITLSFQIIKFLTPKQQDNIYKQADDFTEFDILNLCFISLEQLRRFFEKNYWDYIDKNIQIPHRSALLKIYGVEKKLNIVKSALLKLDLDATLLKVIYPPFLKLSTISLGDRMTYTDLIYLTTYLNTFYEEIRENEVLTTAQVIELLYRVNYNSLEFQNFKTKQFRTQMEKHEEIAEKIDFLYHCLKSVSQRNSKVNIAYDVMLPSVKAQLSGWIEEEITYYNKKLQLINLPKQINLFSDSEKVKIQSGLTVNQLALFFRLQADAGIISHKIQRDIFRHIAESYQTSKVNEISLESIKNKYYNIDNSTIEAVKHKVIEILNQLKSH